MLTESFPKAREVMQAPTAMRDTTSSMLPTDSFSGFWRGGNKKRTSYTYMVFETQMHQKVNVVFFCHLVTNCYVEFVFTETVRFALARVSRRLSTL